MRLARKRVLAACMVVVVFAQVGTARPSSCVSDPSEHRGQHDHHSEVSAEHGTIMPATDLTAAAVAAVTSGGPSSHTTPDSQSCVTTTHCSLNPATLESPTLATELPFVTVEGPGSTWFVHVAPATHATPPPKA